MKDILIAADHVLYNLQIPKQNIERSKGTERLNRMRVAILAGGLGSCLAVETEVKPKPMVEIGGRLIIWHIMMYYSQFNLNNFVIALG